MARSRLIKPGFFKNEYLVSMPMATRLLFAGLWTLADRDGRLEDRPLKIKMEVFPADDVDVDAALTQLANAPEPFIVRYESQGVRIIEVVNWQQHQKPHHQEKDSILPSREQVRTKARISSDKQAKRGVKVTSNKQQDNPKGESEGEGGKSPSPKDSGFDEWYAAYPRKVGKAEAKKAYCKAVALLAFCELEKNRTSEEFLLDRAKAFAASDVGRSGEFCPHPSTWLNQGRYDDDPTTWQRGSPGRPSPSDHSASQVYQPGSPTVASL